MIFPFQRRSTRRQQVSPVRHLEFQALEQRQLLAADVSAVSIGNTLLLFGGNEDDAIEVRLDANDEVTVFGQNGTTVNGEDSFTVPGDAPANIRAFLGSGDDTILFDGIDVSGSVYVFGHRGDDAIGFLRTTIGHDVAVYGGPGELNFSLDLSSVGDDLRVISGRSDDVLVFDESTVGDDTFVSTGGGDDTLVVHASQHLDDVLITTGSGDDVVAVVGLQPVSEDGEVIPTILGDDVFVSLGRGADELLISDAELVHYVFVSGGRGADVLGLSNAQLNRTPRLYSISVEEIGDEEATELAETVDQAIADLVDSGARRPTLVDIATGNENFTSLVTAVVQAGLLPAISTSAPLTVFAPLNSAFDEVFTALNWSVNEEGAIVDSSDQVIPADVLQPILLYHVAGGELESFDVVASSSIETLLIQDEEPTSFDVFLGFDGDGALNSVSFDDVGAELQLGLGLFDIRARNGIVHVIDAVLTPPA